MSRRRRVLPLVLLLVLAGLAGCASVSEGPGPIAIYGNRQTFEIAPVPDGCELVHRRSYRGLVTRYLATVWRAREEEEQEALLRDWCWEAGTIAAQRRYAV